MPTKRSSFSLGIRDIIYIAALFINIGIQWAQVGSVRADLNSLSERYRVEVVPRTEHMQMNAVTEERWRAVGDRLTHVEGQLESIQKQLMDIRTHGGK